MEKFGRAGAGWWYYSFVPRGLGVRYFGLLSWGWEVVIFVGVSVVVAM